MPVMVNDDDRSPVNRPSLKDRKTAVLLQLRDDNLAAIARLRKGGVNPSPLPAVVAMLEHELASRDVVIGGDTYRVEAEKNELGG